MNRRFDLAMAAGALVALPVAGWLVARLGSRVVTSASAAALSGAVVLPVLTPGVASSASLLDDSAASSALTCAPAEPTW